LHKFVSILRQKSILCRFTLSFFQYCDHNNNSQFPVVIFWRPTWPRPWALTLSSLADWNGQLHQPGKVRVPSIAHLAIIRASLFGFFNYYNLRRPLYLLIFNFRIPSNS
jgi:hypothetical protein